jgi:AraC-like DNA-binding protein
MRNTFETTDPGLAGHLLCGGNRGTLRVAPRGQPGKIRGDEAQLTPAVRLDRFSCACALEVEAAEPLGLLFIVHVRAGRLSYSSAGSERRYGRGDVCLAVQPEHASTIQCDHVDIAVAVIHPAVLGRIAGPAPGRSPRPVRLIGYQPISARAAEHWMASYAYVHDEILSLPRTAAHPLLASAAEHLLATAALATFPNNALTDPTIEDRHDAHHATLRRAVTFIDENAHLDITISDIAGAASVTVRAVQLAFRRYLDTTPLAYLRRVRLEGAHRELLTADPARETVTSVAYRWGFASPSRFAAQYRAAYGVTPGRTLRG